MKVNIVDVDEIDKYLKDYFEKSNQICLDAKQILEDFKKEYLVDEKTEKATTKIIESYAFYRYLDKRYNEDLKNSIRLLQYAIKDTQSPKRIEYSWPLPSNVTPSGRAPTVYNLSLTSFTSLIVSPLCAAVSASASV